MDWDSGLSGQSGLSKDIYSELFRLISTSSLSHQVRVCSHIINSTHVPQIYPGINLGVSLEGYRKHTEMTGKLPSLLCLSIAS